MNPIRHAERSRSIYSPRKRKGRRFFDKLRMTEERKNPSEMKNEGMKVINRRKENKRMKTTEEILAALREYKRTHGPKYGIEQLALFGSTARGAQREDSDIDICLKLRKTTFRTYTAIHEELQQLFQQKVDLLTLHENMRQLFRQNIEQDAIYV